jgi:Tol biopolymer transport system component
MTKRIATVFVCGATLAAVVLHARFAGRDVALLANNSMTAESQCLEQKIAFTSTRDFNAEIYLMNPDGTGVERVTNNLVGNAFPALRPDGKRIVFDSNRLRTEGESTSGVFVYEIAHLRARAT